MKGGRKLEILDINDNPGLILESGSALGRHFRVSQIASWKGAQDVLAGHRSMPRPDLLLLDVNFDKDPSVTGAAIEGVTAETRSVDRIVPVGPTIALCFLNQRLVMGFAAYSANMGNPVLLHYAPFLVSIGLVAARSEGAVFTSQHLSVVDNGAETLDEHLAGIHQNANQRTALVAALQQYRRNLQRAICERRITVRNRAVLMAAIKSVKSHDDATPHALELVGSEMVDSISVLSLFADRVNWVGDGFDPTVRAEILDWLEGCGDPDPALPVALEVIRRQGALEEVRVKGTQVTRKRPRVDALIQEHSELNREEQREVLRLCVLFANVHAWHTDDPPRKARVYERLGLDSSGYDYKGLFGLRGEKMVELVCKETINVAPLPCFQVAETGPRDSGDAIFLGRRSILSEDDDLRVLRYQRTFRESENYIEGRLEYQVRLDDDGNS